MNSQLSNKLSGLRIIAQNIRSFNVSAKSFKLIKSKLLTVIDNNPDIVILSECKISQSLAKANISRFMSLSKKGPYDSFFNSSKKSRGVTIFIKSGTFDQVNIIYQSPSQNSIILKCMFGGEVLFIVGLYLSDNQADISNLYEFLPTNATIIVGGI